MYISYKDHELINMDLVYSIDIAVNSNNKYLIVFDNNKWEFDSIEERDKVYKYIQNNFTRIIT